MTQVLLVNPPYMFALDGKYLSERCWMPLGLLSLASVLKKNGISVKVLDLMPLKMDLSEILNFIEDDNPKIIGITGSSAQVRGIVQLGKSIKKKFGKKITLVLGGTHISADPSFLKDFPFFDIGFVGEGEITFPKIVKEILNGNKIKGIVHGTPVFNLDDLPLPDRRLLVDKNYQGPYGEKFATIHSARGCPFNCLYCSSPVEKLSKVRFRSPENVIGEIEMCVKELGYDVFVFTDDTFTLDKKRAENFCREIIKKKLKIRWICETRANLVDKQLLSMMKRSGCVEISFGVESGSERIRNEVIQKNITDKELFRAFAICHDIGMLTNAFIMAGFPTETKNELKQTWDFCFKAKPDIIGIHLTTILPGSSIFEIAVKEGEIKRDIWTDYAKGKVKQQPIYVPKGLTLQDLENFQKSLYHKFYFRPSWLFSRLKISFFSFGRLKEDLKIASRLLLKGRMKSRSYREEDYL